VISKEDLEDGYNDPSVDLVIYPEVGTVESQRGNQPVDITAKTITAGNDFSARGNGDIRLTATNDIRIDGTTLSSTGSQATISITSTDGRIFANSTTMEVSPGSIELNSNGDIYIISANLDAGSYTADLTTPAATLYVDQLSLGNNGQTLFYTPNSVTENGTPTQGGVEPV
jgi:hypothetical protein